MKASEVMPQGRHNPKDVYHLHIGVYVKYKSPTSLETSSKIRGYRDYGDGVMPECFLDLGYAGEDNWRYVKDCRLQLRRESDMSEQ